MSTICTYTIEKDTTGIVVAVRGHYALIYPYTRFQWNKGAKCFSFYKGKDLIELHLGLFGICLSKSTGVKKK
jgi:hypothetical protein